MIDKNWFVHNLPQILICGGVLLSALGGWISYSRMIKYRDENISLGNENKVLNEENLKTTRKVNKVAEKNQELIITNTILTETNKGLIKSNIEIAKSNTELSNQIIGASEVIKSEITGGTSYLKLKIQYQETNKKIVVFYSVKGDYNIQTVRLMIYEMSLEHGKVGERILDKNFAALNNNVNDVIILEASGEPTNLFYQAIIRSRNGDYRQYFMFKKHSDNVWYNHSVYFDDENNKWFREEVYSAIDWTKQLVCEYPDQLKNVSPSISDFIHYKKDNLNSIRMIQDSISSSKNYSDKEISEQTYTPIWIVEKIRKGEPLN